MTNDDLTHFLNEEFQVNERVEAFKKRRFYSVEIELTDGCCLSCNYCYVSSRQNAEHELTLEKAKELIDSLIGYGIKRFWWGGGEPLLNSQWKEILGYAKKKGVIENLVFTNAFLLTKETCQDLRRLADRVTIHLDTIRSSTFEKLQMHKNKHFHTNILNGIDNLLKTGFDNNMIRWNITLTRTSLPDLEDTLKFAICEKKIKTVVLIPLFKCGRASAIYQNEKLSVDELKYAFSLRAKIENRPYLLKLGPSEFCKQYQLTSFAINAKGDVLPYVDCFTPIGNVYHENVCDIITKNFDFLSFKELVSTDTYKNRLHGKCKGCKDEKYCFGNPTMTLNNIGTLLESDPYCWRGSSVRERRTSHIVEC